jgi:hypothetical protein
MYLNDSFNANPTVQMLVTKDKPELWQVCTVKAGDQATMEYGGPYWQLFSSHLTKEDHEKLQAAYPHIPFPPVWPHPPSNESGTLNYKEIGKAEWDYAVASKNLYDVLDDDEAPSGQVNPRVVASEDASMVAHQEHPRSSRPEQRIVQQSLTYHSGIHRRLQGWHEGHATGTNWDPILVVTKVMTTIAEGAGHHVPKLTAYQVRKGVIDFTLERFSLNEIAQGQAGEALQQVVKQVSQPYSDRMKSVFPKEVEQDIITKLTMRCCQTIPDTPYASIVHPDVTLFMLTQEWLQNEWHRNIRRWRRPYEVLYIHREELDQWTTIPQQYTVTVLIEDSTQRYTSWFRAGFLQNSQIVAPTAAKVSRPPASSPDIRRHMVSMQSNTQDTTWVLPTVDKIEKAKAKGESEQWTSTKPSTAPYSPSTNWLSQMANKAQTKTEGHKAKKSRMMKVKESLQSLNTDGRNQSSSSSSSSSVNTLCGVSRPQKRAQLRNEDNTAGSMKKRRLEVEEYSLDSLRLLQSQEQTQVDRMQEILPSSVDSPTHPTTDPPRQRKKRRQHREDDRIS